MKLTNIKTALAKILAQFERISTDKGLLSFDGEELEVGMSVSLVDEEGNESKPEDGEYATEEGIVYVIADGKVSDIKELPKEDTTGDDVQPEDVTEEESFSLIHRMAVKFESFLEKEDKIRAALANKGIEGWLVDAGDDFVVVGVWKEDAMQDTFWKYAVSWDENGDAVIGEGEEVKSAFVPVEEEIEKTPVEENFEEEEDKDQKITNLEAEVARLEEELGAARERISELEAENEELKNKPAAEPAKDEFAKINKTENTGNKRIDNLNRILNA